MQGKKSFILYTDQREIFNQLTDAQAGKLIKHIFAYVNDENPETKDIVTKISFTPIKLQLKRDLKEWERKQEQRIQAGKASAEKRKQALTEFNDRSISLTVNDNVNGNVNVNNNKAFVADANKDQKHYRQYLHTLVKEKQVSRDQLFNNNKIDYELRNTLWEDFIKNSIINVPLIEDEKHAWNTFKKFIIDNKLNYQVKQSDFKGFG